MTARMPIVGGNWKMNLDLASAVELADDVVAGCAAQLGACEVALFPPFPYLQAVGRALGHHGVVLGAQNVYPGLAGAFTGEVSASMLQDLHVTMVLVGHSERRHVIGERDELIAAKVGACLDAALRVVLCIGETAEERQADRTHDVLATQLARGLEAVAPDRMRDVVVAYEPVWAIGTGQTATPADAQREHAFVRDCLADRFGREVADATRIQYGGSVKPDNAAELIEGEDVDGFLVGGASLRADSFLAIVRAAARTGAGAGAGSSPNRA